MTETNITKNVGLSRWIIGIIIGLIVLAFLIKKARAPKSANKAPLPAPESIQE